VAESKMHSDSFIGGQELMGWSVKQKVIFVFYFNFILTLVLLKKT
jgi:hypothetical protein